VFDYTGRGGRRRRAGAAPARETFARLEFHPFGAARRVKVNPTTTILGKPSAQPFALAPTGFTR